MFQTKQKKTILMTEGGIVKPLILFILPLIGSSIFQQLYNTVDFMFVGNVMNRTSAAAVGASSTLITCLIGIFGGVSIGTSVVCAQAVGGGKAERADKAMHSSVTFGVLGSLVLMAAGIAFAPQILTILNTPESSMPEAITYIRIYLLSMPVMVFYNMCAGTLRALGDTQTPFRILVICGFVNVAADYLLIVTIPLGVAGVAIATAISQGLSAVLVAMVLLHEGRPVRLSAGKLGIDREILAEVLRIGIPAGIQSVIITFSNVIVQYYINAFGETAVAAFATYYKVENFIYLPIMAFGQAATTFAGQNTGAGQFGRVKKGTWTIALIGAVTVACLAAIVLTFSRTIFTWFMKDQDVVTDALRIAFVSFPFYWIYPVMEVTGGALRGMGYSIRSMVVIIINLCIIRITLLAVFSATIHTLESMGAVYPITWATAMICFVMLFILTMREKNRKEEFA